jgi:hypothetical protein
MIDLRDYSGSQFIKLADVKDGPIRRTIAGLVDGKYGKPDCIFDDGSRLSLNKTNVKTLRRAYGDFDADQVGKEIELFEGDFLTNDGTTTPGVAVRQTRYPFAVENVREFVAFLRECGGFEIC